MVQLEREPTAEELTSLLGAGPILLYDGQCGICATSVRWVLEHERSSELRFAAIESPMGQRLRNLARVASEVDSLIWVESVAGKVKARVYSSSVLAVLDYVGGPWQAAYAALWIFPKPLRDLGYRIFARFRKHIAPEHCPLPTQEQRQRFFPAHG